MIDAFNIPNMFDVFHSPLFGVDTGRDGDACELLSAGRDTLDDDDEACEDEATGRLSVSKRAPVGVFDGVGRREDAAAPPAGES